MNILLTGGAGYVGSVCLRRLASAGHRVYAYDNLSEGNAAAIGGDQLIHGDIRDRERLRDAMQMNGIEAVMHFAALASVPDSIADPHGYYDVNFSGTKQVLDAMLDCGVKRIVVSSTAATYSFDTPMPLLEDSPQVPRIPCRASKLAAEMLIKDYGRAYGMGYVIFRYFNASGADANGTHGECRRNESHLIPLALNAILHSRSPLKVYGTDYPTPDGTCIRDYVHVEDLAAAHRLAVESIVPTTAGIYNLGLGNGVSVQEILRACESVTGRKVPHERVGRHPGDPAVLVASPERCKRELGWRPQFVDVRDIIRSAWQWHSRHPHGYPSRQACIA